MTRRLLWAVFFLLIAAPAAHARYFEPFGPFPYRNPNPLYLQMGALRPTAATVLPTGVVRADITTSYSSVYNVFSGNGLSENMDMEVMRTALNVDAGLPLGIEAGIEVPFLREDGGFLDAFVQKYHRLFGFPNAGRELRPNNEFHAQVSQGGVPIYQYGPTSFALSDISLRAKWQVLDEGHVIPALSVIGTLKLPTGKPSKGTGNGNVDEGLGAALQKSLGRVHTYVNAECFHAGGFPGLSATMVHYYMNWMAAAEVSLGHVTSLMVEFYGVTPIFKGMGKSQWDGPVADLLLGVQGRYPHVIAGQEFHWQFGFVEDLYSDGPSVDFTAFLNIGVTFDIFSRHRYRGDMWARR